MVVDMIRAKKMAGRALLLTGRCRLYCRLHSEHLPLARPGCALSWQLPDRGTASELTPTLHVDFRRCPWLGQDSLGAGHCPGAWHEGAEEVLWVGCNVAHGAAQPEANSAGCAAQPATKRSSAGMRRCPSALWWGRRCTPQR